VVWRSFSTLSSGVIARGLRRLSGLEVRDYGRLLHLQDDYSVMECPVREGDWLVGKRLRESRLRDEGIMALGIQREDGGYVGVPRGETNVHAGDRLILYGLERDLRELDARRAGSSGEDAHEHAVDEQRKRTATQALEERARERRREERDKATSEEDGRISC